MKPHCIANKRLERLSLDSFKPFFFVEVSIVFAIDIVGKKPSRKRLRELMSEGTFTCVNSGSVSYFLSQRWY
jgi:hypothetical protein